MRKFCFCILSIFLCSGLAWAAGRVQTTNTKKEIQTVSNRVQNNSKNTTVSRAVSNRSPVTTRINDNTNKKTVSRTTANKTVSARLNTRTPIARSGVSSRRVSRAATNVATISFGGTYNACRDSYFTCMDQFCANQNDTYRRCVCSSRLTDIKSKEKLLNQTADNLQDFQDLNIDVISKTADEVTAMLNPTEGETASKKDTSTSSKILNEISDVLQKSKKQSLSTSGTLDIAGNIKNIWSTTDFIGNTNIANLTGDALYNAVHAQCVDIVSQNCSTSDLTMVVSAYGMYIENDCALLDAGIESRITAANTAIRTTRHQMQDARLENYNTHNSLSINDCIASVRNDITASTACGDGYTHCLDFSGKYLNATTGEPIYSSDFYQLENQLSLSGDILKNEKNAKFVNMLNKKRIFAQKSLDMCVDNADAVWDEFLRQAIVEIYQHQQQRVQDVKSECLQVVNECYLNKSETLKEFANDDDLVLLGHTLELSEDLCADKLTTCSNLYGGGDMGLSVLVNTMREITNETIAQTCPGLLETFATNICSVSANDSTHSYPYGCRVYAPGEMMYARNAICNTTLVNPFSKSDILVQESIIPDSHYSCLEGNKRYTSCEFNRYLYHPGLTSTTTIQELCKGTYANFTTPEEITAYYNAHQSFCKNDALECRICPHGYICMGGDEPPEDTNSKLYDSCGMYYIGSLYQQLVRYALQNCTRPSETTSVLSESLLSDVDMVMRKVKTTLIGELSSECENYGGTWVDIPWVDDDFDAHHDVTNDTLLESFYTGTGTNKLWGYCK